MHEKRFDPAKLEKLNNPERLLDIPPATLMKYVDLSGTSPATFIDIGAGTGLFTVPIHEYTKGGTSWACDISEVMIDWLRENISEQSPKIKPLLMQENSIPLADNFADLIYMMNLHHELDKPMEMLSECYRLLKNHGKICIVDWKQEEMPQGPPLSFRCNKDEVLQQLEKAGFKNVQIHPDFAKHFVIVAKKE